MKLKTILLLTALVAGAALPGWAAEQKKRPNILFIVADDQSPFDFKTYDPRSTLDAPNIERLAREGMVFDQAYHMGSMSGAVSVCRWTSSSMRNMSGCLTSGL